MPTKKTSQKKFPAKSSTRMQKTTRPISSTTRVGRTKLRIRAFLARRPHRSFRRTRRRDYVRSLDLPGYVSFTASVVAFLWRYRKTYGLLIVFLAVASALLSTVASQDTFNQFVSTIQAKGGDIFSGSIGEIGRATILLVLGINGSLANTPTDSQKICATIIALFSWLVTVWLLRAQSTGGRPRLRDGLYNAGAPIVSTFSLVLLGAVQLLPAGLASVAISAVASNNAIQNGFLSMIFYLVCFLLFLISIYLIVSTFFALVIVTLPGMYPWQALKTAGDLVTGRRLRVLLRLCFGGLVIVLAWIVIMLPLIMLTTWLQTSLKWTAWIPIVPTALTVLSSATVVFAASYVYMLYRRMIDDGSAPA